MEAYQVRLIEEFTDIYIRTKKIVTFIESIDATSYDYKTPLELMLEQLDVMIRYIEILIERFYYEGINDKVPYKSIMEKAEKVVAESRTERAFK